MAERILYDEDGNTASARKRSEKQETATAGQPGRARLIAVIVTSISAFFTPFMSAAVVVALPSICAELHMDTVLLTWIITAFLLSTGVFLVPMGRAADIWGRRKVYLTGITVFAIMSLLCATARSWQALIIYRFFQGIGSAAIFGSGMAIVTSLYPPSERGKVLGINIGAIYVGTSLGPFLGGLLTDHLGWRSIFFVVPPVAIAIIIAVFFGIKQEWAEAKGESFDFGGSLIYGSTLAALIVGFTLLSSPAGPFLILLAAGGIALFIKWENRASYPMLPPALFKGNRLFVFSNLCGIASYAATYAIALILSLYFQSVRGMTAGAAGLVLVSQPIVQSLFTVLAGHISDRKEPRIVASIGMGVIALGILLLVPLSPSTGIPYVVGVLALVGFGVALFAAPNANALMASVSPRLFGVASGALISTGSIGQLISMGITSLAFAICLGRVKIGSIPQGPLLATFKVLFVIFSLLSIAGLVASAMRGKAHKEAATDPFVMEDDSFSR